MERLVQQNHEMVLALKMIPALAFEKQKEMENFFEMQTLGILQKQLMLLSVSIMGFKLCSADSTPELGNFWLICAQEVGACKY